MTSAIESFDGKRGLVININTKDITKYQTYDLYYIMIFTIFRNWRSRKAFLCLISVFSTFPTNFKILSPYLFLKTSAIESFDGKRSLVRNIITKDVTKYKTNDLYYIMIFTNF